MPAPRIEYPTLLKMKSCGRPEMSRLEATSPGNSLEDRGGAQHEAPGSISRRPPGSPERLQAPCRHQEGLRPPPGAGKVLEGVLDCGAGARSASRRTAAVLKGVPGLPASRLDVSGRPHDFRFSMGGPTFGATRFQPKVQYAHPKLRFDPQNYLSENNPELKLELASKADVSTRQKTRSSRVFLRESQAEKLKVSGPATRAERLGLKNEYGGFKNQLVRLS